MVWLIWRQHRAQALITGGLLVALGMFLLVLGLGNVEVAARLASDRNALDQALQERFYHQLANLFFWLALAPVAIGVFWGAPLLGREFERGTHQLAWTQSVPVRRWLAMKLGVLATAVVLAGLGLGAMVNGWLSTFDGTRYGARFSNQVMFMLTGVAPAAWWLFAFMTGVAAGAVFRRTRSARAATLATVLVTFTIVSGFSVRDHYAPPERIELAFTSSPEDALESDSLVLGRDLVDANGRPLSESELANALCSPPDPACTPPPGVRQVVYYHPPSRYWRFQWTETALLLTATLALAAVAIARTARSRL